MIKTRLAIQFLMKNHFNSRMRSVFGNKDICSITEKDYDAVFNMFEDKRKSDQVYYLRTMASFQPMLVDETY